MYAIAYRQDQGIGVKTAHQNSAISVERKALACELNRQSARVKSWL